MYSDLGLVKYSLFPHQNTYKNTQSLDYGKNNLVYHMWEDNLKTNYFHDRHRIVREAMAA